MRPLLLQWTGNRVPGIPHTARRSLAPARCESERSYPLADRAGHARRSQLRACLTFEEGHLQILAEGHAGAMEHDPKIRLADVQHLAHFLARYVVHFTHDKDLGHTWREPVETALHGLPELGALHRFFALRLPIRGTAFVNPVVFTIEWIRVFVA